MKNKRILITGMAGSIGSELLRQLAQDNHIYGIDINETGVFDLIEEYKQAGHSVHGRVGDIRDEKTVEDIFSDFKPEVIFHAAAYKHVTPMEWYPREAVNTNILGTLNVIEYAKKYEAEKFVFISTDKAVQSSSIMGATKRVSEIIVRNQGKGFVVVRFGNVLGSRGSVIPLWQKQIEGGKALTVTDERMERFIMTIDEAVDLVIKAAEMGKGGEIIILDMGRKIKIIDFARDLIKASRYEIEGGGDPIKMIGTRPGEQLTEKLMFEEEEVIAAKEGKFFVIR